MAFRDDSDALHARIESLEKELAEARSALAALDGVVQERDRLKSRLEALEPKKKPPRREPPSAAPIGGSPRLPSSLTPQARLLAGLVGLLVVGLGVYAAITWTGPDAPAAPKPPDTRAPSIGVIDLAATPDPAPIAFAVTGSDEAPSGCPGYLPRDPQLVLRASSPMLLRATTRCDVDLVALLSGLPTGALCDDDGGDGTNPMIQTTLPAGDTRLTLGTYSEGASANCEIVLQAMALPENVDPNGLASRGTPRLATVALGGAAGAESAYDGEITSAILEGRTLQPGCLGWFAPVPDLALDVTEPTIARLDASSERDLVLLMQDPDGSFTCDDDDGAGNAPRIAKRLAPGHYPIWVGTFGEEPVPTAFHVGVRLATIASEAAMAVPTTEVVDGAPTHLTGTSGDELSAPSMWADCAAPGYVSYVPSQTFQLAARRDVTIASGRGDLLLAVVPHERSTARTALTCTTEPAWRGTLDAGRYDLYVGVASGEYAPSTYDLTIGTAAPSVLPYAP